MENTFRKLTDALGGIPESYSYASAELALLVIGLALRDVEKIDSDTPPGVPEYFASSTLSLRDVLLVLTIWDEAATRDSTKPTGKRRANDAGLEAAPARTLYVHCFMEIMAMI